MNAFDQEKRIEDLQAVLAQARRMAGGNGRAGTVGYCLGGRLAMMMALRTDAEVNISSYGVGLDDLAENGVTLRAPLLRHIAEQDSFFPPEGSAKLVAALRDEAHARAFVYPKAEDAFARVGGTHWDARSATIANGRSAEALALALG